jgi:energy-coupling factor transporter ATP-binding protein EcfA2
MDFSDLILRSEREGRALELLRMVGLGKHAHKMPAEVSGGQQQVAAIARALANDPPLIIADEPTGNLDSRTAESVMEIFERLVERGKTIIMVTHDPTLAQRTTRSLLLADGEIIHDVVATTFPMLTHSEMLKITHELEVRQYAPGATVVREGNAIDDFQIITKGSVQIAVKDVPVTKLSSGEFFGEIELLQEQPAIATIRNTDVTFLETVSINRNSFRQLVLDTKEFKETILPVVHTRLTENHSVRSRLGLNRRKHAQTTLA